MLRQLKIKHGFSSDNATVYHLLNHHQSLCLLRMLATSTEAQQLGGTSVAETGNENFEDIAQNMSVVFPKNLLTGAAKNIVEMEQLSELLVDTRRKRNLLFSGEQFIGSQCFFKSF